MKIFTTAIFTVLILRRRLGLIQWCALIVLILGISLVQIENVTSKTPQKDVNAVVGLLAAVSACKCEIMCICIMLIFRFLFLLGICSGFAGVYFEKVLKDNNISLWIREVQLATFGMIFSFLAMYISDKHEIETQGVLFGYTKMVWVASIAHSVGGLLVALVVKYADNILKGFASSSAIVLTCIISLLFFDFQPTLLFLLGTLLVIFSILLYSNPKIILHVPFFNSFAKDKAILF